MKTSAFSLLALFVNLLVSSSNAQPLYLAAQKSNVARVYATNVQLRTETASVSVVSTVVSAENATANAAQDALLQSLRPEVYMAAAAPDQEVLEVLAGTAAGMDLRPVLSAPDAEQLDADTRELLESTFVTKGLKPAPAGFSTGVEALDQETRNVLQHTIINQNVWSILKPADAVVDQPDQEMLELLKATRIS